MKKDSVEFFEKKKKKDEIIGEIREDEQNNVKPSQLRFINIIIINNDNKIVVPKRSSNRKLFPNCYDFSVGGHVNSGENYEEAAYRELKEELGIENVKLKEVAYFSPFNSDSNTFQKVYLLRYTNKICEYDRDGIDEIYYKSKKEIQELMKKEPNLFKTDYSVVMKYLFDKDYYIKQVL